jgi:hypothetical protein
LIDWYIKLKAVGLFSAKCPKARPSQSVQQGRGRRSAERAGDADVLSINGRNCDAKEFAGTKDSAEGGVQQEEECFGCRRVGVQKEGDAKITVTLAFAAPLLIETSLSFSIEPGQDTPQGFLANQKGV